ncbi:MAG: hypothetical protein ACJ8H8_01540, partial [Geminicoccaceae bacterium]
LRGEPCRDYQTFENRLSENQPTESPGGGSETPATSGTGAAGTTQTGRITKKKCKKRKGRKSATAARKRCRK